MVLADEKYVLLTTFKRDSTPVSSPVWCVPADTERIAFYTSSTSGKVERLAHTERVTVQPCNARGTVKDGSTAIEAVARVVTGPELEDIRAKVVAKYGFMTKLTRFLAKVGGIVKRKEQPYADRGVIVTPSG